MKTHNVGNTCWKARSVKGCRMKSDSPHVMHLKSKHAPNAGYVDPASVSKTGKKSAPKLSTSAKRKLRAKKLAAARAA